MIMITDSMVFVKPSLMQQNIINRPGVARTVLQTPSSLMVSKSWFVEIYSKQHNSQAVRSRELTFGENVHLPTCVKFHVSHVTCHVSRVTCHMSFFFFDKIVELVHGGSVINGPSPSSLVDPQLIILIILLSNYVKC